MRRTWLVLFALFLAPLAWAESPAHVQKPVPGLYESIHPIKAPRGWHIRDFSERFHLPSDAVGTATRVSQASHPERVGAFFRGYVPSRRQLLATVDYLRYPHPRYGGPADVQAIPGWIEGGHVPLVPGRGTPTVTYMTLRFLRRQQVPYGGLREAVAVQIENDRSMLDLPALRLAGTPLQDALRSTHTYRYMETMLTQSGHRIVSTEARYHKLLHTWTDDELYDLPGDPKALSRFDGYDLHFQLEPLTLSDP